MQNICGNYCSLKQLPHNFNDHTQYSSHISAGSKRAWEKKSLLLLTIIASPSTRPGRLPARTGKGRSLWPTAAWGRGWGSPTGGRARRPRASGSWSARPVNWRRLSYLNLEPSFLLTEKSTRMSHSIGKLSVHWLCGGLAVSQFTLVSTESEEQIKVNLRITFVSHAVCGTGATFSLSSWQCKILQICIAFTYLCKTL